MKTPIVFVDLGQNQPITTITVFSAGKVLKYKLQDYGGKV
jgi:hypothetical protein